MSEETFGSADSVGGDIDRRKFLSGIIGVVATAVAVMVGIPAIGYLVSPGLKKQNEDQWITLGPVSSLTPGEPTGFPYSTRSKDGWVESSQSGVAYAVDARRSERDGLFERLHAPELPRHLARLSERDYFCPCHDGRVRRSTASWSADRLRGPWTSSRSRSTNGQIMILLEA